MATTSEKHTFLLKHHGASNSKYKIIRDDVTPSFPFTNWCLSQLITLVFQIRHTNLLVHLGQNLFTSSLDNSHFFEITGSFFGMFPNVLFIKMVFIFWKTVIVNKLIYWNCYISVNIFSIRHISCSLEKELWIWLRASVGIIIISFD